MGADVAAGAALDRAGHAVSPGPPAAGGSVVAPGVEDPAAGGAGPGEDTGVAAAEPVELFEAFYRSHVDRVYRALAVTLGDPQLAREATDEAMARAYAHWGRLRSLNNPGGWVYRVGLNWATSWWRKRRRERALPAAGTMPSAVHPAAPPPDPVATAAQLALAELALPMRTVVVCRVLLDMSTMDTAVLLGVAEGTVRSRLSRALAALRATLTDDSTDEEQS